MKIATGVGSFFASCLFKMSRVWRGTISAPVFRGPLICKR
jgi:hypothetical protein